MNCLNRFDLFGWLLAAWRETGNPLYSRFFDATIIDWATHNPCPDALSGGKACVPQGLPGTPCAWGAADVPGAQACATGTMESPWRSLEMGIRMEGIFAGGFFGFQRAAEFSTSARALMVLTVGEHNAALSVDGGHPGSGTPNWEMCQWDGLLQSCINFPEMKNCSGLITRALYYLQALLDEGVYPDGVETEQASGYELVHRPNLTAAYSRHPLTLLLIRQLARPNPNPAQHVDRGRVLCFAADSRLRRRRAAPCFLHRARRGDVELRRLCQRPHGVPPA